MNKNTRCPTCHKEGRNKPGTNTFICRDCINVWTVSDYQQTSIKFSSIPVDSLIKHPHHGICRYVRTESRCLSGIWGPVTHYIVLKFLDGEIYEPESKLGSLEVLNGHYRVNAMSTQQPNNPDKE